MVQVQLLQVSLARETNKHALRGNVGLSNVRAGILKYCNLLPVEVVSICISKLQFYATVTNQSKMLLEVTVSHSSVRQAVNSHLSRKA